VAHKRTLTEARTTTWTAHLQHFLNAGILGVGIGGGDDLGTIVLLTVRHSTGSSANETEKLADDDRTDSDWLVGGTSRRWLLGVVFNAGVAVSASSAGLPASGK